METVSISYVNARDLHLDSATSAARQASGGARAGAAIRVASIGGGPGYELLAFREFGARHFAPGVEVT